MFQHIKKLGLNIKGFTLFELLIIIFVLSLITGAASYFFGSAREEARDFQRISDIEAIQDALGLYFIDQGYYPEAITEGESIVSPDGNTVYLAKIPTAPIVPNPTIDNEGYNYVRAASTTSYTINYYLAGETGGQGSQGGTVSMAYFGNCTANPETFCEGKCIPSCTGKTCGDNGCGGNCGTCDAGYSCVSGACSIFAGGNGTAESPYQINNCQGLQAMEDNLTASYVLVNDLDCAETTSWNDGQGFDPIGNDSPFFKGSLDGQGHIVNNLYINREDETNCALIGTMTKGTITKIGLENVDISCKGPYVAGMVAMARNWDGNISITQSYVGNGSIVGSDLPGGTIGGFAGLINLQNSSNALLVSDCYSLADVAEVNLYGTSNGTYYGGFVGMMNNNPLISDSYATGNVSGNHYVGGFAGSAGYNSINFDSCFSAGIITVTKPTGYSGGFCGANNSWVSSSYWNDLGDNATRNCYYSGNSGCIKVSTTFAGDLTHFYSSANAPMSSWDFVEVWRESDTYPVLRVFD